MKKTRSLVTATVIVVWGGALLVRAIIEGGTTNWIVGIGTLIGAAALAVGILRQTGSDESKSQTPESGQQEDRDGRS